MTLYDIVKVIAGPIAALLYRIEVRGQENIPKEGAAILFTNHVRALDPLLVGLAIERHIIYMAKEELFDVPVLGWVLKKLGMFPVKRNTGDISAIRSSLKVLSKGKLLGIFPEGTRSSTGEIGEVYGGIAMIAIKGKTVVVPSAISKDYRLFKKTVIQIGKPLDLSIYYDQKMDSKKFKDISQEMMEKVKLLSRDL
jgi:1-acyl-sn-glycerol-3-phosphate acyltransferase